MGIVGCPAPLQLARIEGGLSNSTYRLTCADGTRIVLPELAMGEVEDPHHAGDHAQAQHDQHHHRGEGGDVKSKLRCGVEHRQYCLKWKVFVTIV